MRPAAGALPEGRDRSPVVPGPGAAGRWPRRPGGADGPGGRLRGRGSAASAHSVAGRPLHPTHPAADRLLRPIGGGPSPRACGADLPQARRSIRPGLPRACTWNEGSFASGSLASGCAIPGGGSDGAIPMGRYRVSRVSARAADGVPITGSLAPPLPALAVPVEGRGLPVPGLCGLLEPAADLGGAPRALPVGRGCAA